MPNKNEHLNSFPTLKLIISVLPLVTVVCSALFAFATIKADTRNAEEKIVIVNDKIIRLEQINVDISAMKKDIEWIKETLKRR